MSTKSWVIVGISALIVLAFPGGHPLRKVVGETFGRPATLKASLFRLQRFRCSKVDWQPPIQSRPLN